MRARSRSSWTGTTSASSDPWRHRPAEGRRRFRRPQLLPILFNGRGRRPGLRGCAGGDDAGSSRTVWPHMGSYRGSRAAKDTWELGTLSLGLPSPGALRSRSGRVGLPSHIAEARRSLTIEKRAVGGYDDIILRGGVCAGGALAGNGDGPAPMAY